MSDWINVDERMPEIDQKVLVWARIRAPIEEKAGFPFILVYEGGGLTESFSLAGNIATVSHWMHLPEPPST